MNSLDVSNFEIKETDGVFTFKNENTTIGLVRFNENGEVEYGGSFKNVDKSHESPEDWEEEYFTARSGRDPFDYEPYEIRHFLNKLHENEAKAEGITGPEDDKYFAIINVSHL